ncbi:23S rRNA (guanosine(2251)-2'-O)-methyltransferase RlmB [Ornithinimicrobium faecis]|uniref:23S rRNA (Guanosine(2251)-2'-O)-methyltransferase RlmB n=1 Tax=Ornithinimicrobium faecis TaxID=2934158 RepID=A0ABY4YWL0_9MICO|nr:MULTISPECIES: 23S rRNA (guanosine(2251)-2'-O)-methyltransferase RlmB [unclassified Ornithinimicrobium]USQ80748.1 23S rRNA (guanosine(2251)-2'-O)-methyltransferase RlmB [Ornithinimicrobium sp. HY1793]
MAGNSQRKGAVRKTAKKGPQVGSGGQRRKGLEGRGPTPKATERTGHPAARRTQRTTTTRRPPQRGNKASTEVITGRNSVLEALRTYVPASTLYVSSRLESDDRIREAIKLATEQQIPILEANKPELDRLTDGAVHQGLAMLIPPYDYAHPDDLLSAELPGTPLIVALDGITDPRNLGAIIRSVGAFGGHGVVVPARRSAGMTAAAWKTSAGAAARIQVAQATNLTVALQDYRKAGCFVIGLDAEGDVDLPDLELADLPLVVVVGSEGKGLSRLVRETCDQIVSIPMAGVTESLNAGIAGAVTLYEIARKRTR